MTRVSSGDESETDPYMRKAFYTLWMFSLNPKYTEKARNMFRVRELKELKELEKKVKADFLPRTSRNS